MSVRISHGSVRRGRAIILKSGSVEIPCGVVTGIVGINGAGKSTWMLHAAGVLKGAPMPADIVAYGPQQPTFPGWLSPQRIASMFTCDFTAMCAEFPSLALGEIQSCSGRTLSVGQSQTLSIALALAARAPITLLDEPFAPLDFRRRIGLSSILPRRAADTNAAIVISTQSASEIIDTCGWIVVLQEGRYVYAGSVETLSGGGDAEARRRHLERELLDLMLPGGTATRRPAGTR